MTDRGEFEKAFDAMQEAGVTVDLGKKAIMWEGYMMAILNKRPSLDVESLPTPNEVKLGLLDMHNFTVAQVQCIAAEVYQPLYDLLKVKQGN